MARRTESECFTVVCDHIFKILYPTRLLIASKNFISTVVEGRGTVSVARKTKRECFVTVCYQLFKISCKVMVTVC